MANDRKCCVPKCGRSSHKNPELRFFGIPKDPELRPKWMENLKIKRLFYKRTNVCSVHFEDEAKSKNRLKKNAIPTLHLGYDGLVPHKFIKHYVAQRKCCIESCKIQHMIKGVKTYTFPEAKNERLAWARACNLPLPLPEKDIYICERHFERKYKSKMRLLPGAFPKFFLRGEDDEDIEQKNAESNASDADQSNEESNASDAQQSNEESNASEAEQSNEESNASDSEQSNESRIVPDVEVYSMDLEKNENDHFTTQESGIEFYQDSPVKFTYPVDMEEDDSNFNTIEKSEDIELPSQVEHMQILNIQRESIRKRYGKRQAQGVSNEVLPVKLICSRIVEVDKSDDISKETSQDLELSPYEEQIQNLHAQIEVLKKRVMFLKNSAIYPRPGASEDAVTFARMIVGDKKTEYTEKEKALAKRLRSNMLSDDYSFLKQDLGFRLPLLRAVKRKRNLPENDRNLIN